MGLTKETRDWEDRHPLGDNGICVALGFGGWSVPKYYENSRKSGTCVVTRFGKVQLMKNREKTRGGAQEEGRYVGDACKSSCRMYNEALRVVPSKLTSVEAFVSSLQAIEA